MVKHRRIIVLFRDTLVKKMWNITLEVCTLYVTKRAFKSRQRTITRDLLPEMPTPAFILARIAAQTRIFTGLEAIRLLDRSAFLPSARLNLSGVLRCKSHIIETSLEGVRFYFRRNCFTLSAYKIKFQTHRS